MASETGTVLRMEATSFLHLFLAAFVAGIPLFTAVEPPGFWSNLGIGVLIALVASFDEWAERHAHAERVADPSWLLLLAGLWLIVYPFFLDASRTYVWTTVLSGVLLVLSAGYLVVLSTMERIREDDSAA